MNHFDYINYLKNSPLLKEIKINNPVKYIIIKDEENSSRLYIYRNKTKIYGDIYVDEDTAELVFIPYDPSAKEYFPKEFWNSKEDRIEIPEKNFIEEE